MFVFNKRSGRLTCIWNRHPALGLPCNKASFLHHFWMPECQGFNCRDVCWKQMLPAWTWPACFRRGQCAHLAGRGWELFKNMAGNLANYHLCTSCCCCWATGTCCNPSLHRKVEDTSSSSSFPCPTWDCRSDRNCEMGPGYQEPQFMPMPGVLKIKS